MSETIRFDATRFVEVVKVNNAHPEEGMVDNAALLAFYGSQQGAWEGQVHWLKMLLETREATVEDDLRGGTDKLTVAAVSARVALDEEVQSIKRKLALAKMQDTLYSNACKALADRGNNLRSLGTWLRSERANIGTYDTPNTNAPAIPYTKEERAARAKRLANPS